MKKNTVTRPALAIMAALVFSGQAIAEEIVACPTSTRVEQTATPVPDGWKGFDSKASHPFVNVRFYDGPPDQMASLAPSGQRKHKGRPIDQWAFTAPSSPDGYWVACVYGESSVMLAKKLASGVRSCEVAYDPAFSTPVAVKVVCK